MKKDWCDIGPAVEGRENTLLLRPMFCGAEAAGRELGA